MTDLRPAPPTAVDPRSGEVIDLANAPHEDLVEAFLILQDHERRAKEWRTAVEDELVRRTDELTERHEIDSVHIGDYVLEVERGWSRIWDGEELAGALQCLEGESLLKQAECAGLIRRVDELKVDGKKAAALLNQLDGEALVELRRCFKWEQKGRARVKVTAPPQLTK
jgi:hypothetical protein